MKTRSEIYVNYINKNILSRVDYDKIQRSYETVNKTYAKGILKHLHEAMIKVYGDNYLYPDYTGNDEDNGVIIPGVMQSRNTGKICIGLLDLYLSSSGEHWDTHFLCKYSVITHGNPKLPEKQKSFINSFIPYDYAYPAVIPCDHHVDDDALPKGIKEMLETFHKHDVKLLLPPHKSAPVYEPDAEEQDEELEP